MQLRRHRVVSIAVTTGIDAAMSEVYMAAAMTTVTYYIGVEVLGCTVVITGVAEVAYPPPPCCATKNDNFSW